MTKRNDFLNKQRQALERGAEHDALEPEFSFIQAMIEARKSKNITQKQLADRTGIAQADISKLENGNANPTIKILQRLAAGMDMNVKIEFVPIWDGKDTK